MSRGWALLTVIPVGAWLGVNLLDHAKEMPWFRGPTLAQALSDLPPGRERASQALRFPLQDVYKFDDKRIYAGRVESGVLCVGESIRFLPSGRESKIKSIEAFGEPPRVTALPGDAVGITLEDPLFLERGELGFAPENAPRVSHVITADLFWLAPAALKVGSRYAFRCANADLQAQVEAIETVLDPGSLTQTSAAALEPGNIGRVSLSLDQPLAHDFFKENEATGRFVLVEDYRVAGGGRILSDHRAFLSQELSTVTGADRARRFGHAGFVVWMTGLSGAGKSTLARELERRLFADGKGVVVLDSDNLRQGLCNDLGFSNADRAENIRRAAEVAHLFAQAGMIAVTAFVSPFTADRERARQIIGAERFVEIFVDCPLEECERRDPKKLYSRARLGEVTQFTGLSSGYEPPADPALQVHTQLLSPAESVERIVALLRSRFNLG